jgi:ferredoxin
MKKDLTVYATAGDTNTLLAVAKSHKVPVDFECENGECGSCAVEVEILSGKTPMGIALTEKEKVALKLAGKITRQQIEDAEVNDVPPPYRLACQFIVRNEDILVKF